MQRIGAGPRLGELAQMPGSAVDRVDTLDKWFLDQAQTPTGSMLLFVLVFLTRLSIDQYTRKRAARKHNHKRKG